MRGREKAERGGGWNDDDEHYEAAIGYGASHAIARVAVFLQHEISREIPVKRPSSFPSSEIPSFRSFPLRNSITRARIDCTRQTATLQPPKGRRRAATTLLRRPHAAAADVGENDIVRSVRFVSPPRFFRQTPPTNRCRHGPTDGNSVEVENEKIWRTSSLHQPNPLLANVRLAARAASDKSVTHVVKRFQKVGHPI